MYTQRNEKIVKKGGSSSTINYSLLTIHSGMTLVELLVAVSIMVLLVAVSVPMFKPMLESQKSAGGARTVALALQRARVKAMETQSPHGIMFQRFTEGGENNVSIRLFLVKPPKPYTGDAGDNTVTINASGGITSVPTTWTANVQNDDYIQFNYQGKYYKLNGLNLPVADDGTTPPDMTGATFRVLRNPQSGGVRMALTPSVLMPRGTIVDLQWSGLANGQDFNNNFPVIVMFSPDGTVDRVYRNGGSALSNDLIHFCVGEWERGISVGHEDTRNNINVASNFWVTINPRTGEVRTAEMNPDAGSNITNARKFAREHFVNIGGF